jgi:surface antigen
MRIAVLTGVFACAVIFAIGSDRASAATLQTNEATETVQTIERMVAVSEKTKSPLLELVEKEEILPAVDETVVEPIKHIVGKNESLSVIAKQYETTWQNLFYKNISIANPDVLSEGQELIVPELDETLEPREIPVVQVVIAPARNRTNASVSSGSNGAAATQTTQRGSSAGNTYSAGYCTWYVKNRRPDIPNGLGNASTWSSRANGMGLSTGSTPAVGAVGQQGNHVVYVESVNGDGTVTISDMNWSGLYVVTTRTVAASSFTYIY